MTWPVWNEEAHTKGLAFYELLDFLLAFSPVLDEDTELRGRLASIGLDGTGAFKIAALDDERRAAFEAGLADGIAHLAERAGHTASSVGLFGAHEEMAGRYDDRNLGAMKGLYGLPESEAWYGGRLHDSDGDPPVGAGTYQVRFTRESLPDVDFFWSATRYRLPERLLAANGIDRYSIGDHAPGIVYGADGSLTLHIASTEPADPVERANWLPAPAGPFTVIVRAYGGDEDIVAGRYTLQPLTKVG